MNINNAFPATFLKAADLLGQQVNVTISKVTLEDVGSGEMKPILHFLNKEKGCVLNKTNAFLIAEAYGPETDGWVGQSIILSSHKVSFQGKLVDGLHIQPTGGNTMFPPVQPQQAPVQQSAGHQPQPGDALQAIADQVAQAEAEKQRQEQANQAFADDDIPF